VRWSCSTTLFRSCGQKTVPLRNCGRSLVG
jgi:hypothetical protein